MVDKSLGIEKNVAVTIPIGFFYKDGAVVSNPTLAAGDVKIHIGLSANEANIGSLPVAIGDSTKLYKQALTQAETNEDDIVIGYEDAAGDEWDPFSVHPSPATYRNDELSTVTTAQVNAECDTALSDYDGPTKAEMDAGHAALNDPTAAAIAAAVWEETIRGLTQTVAEVADAISGDNLTVTAGVTFNATLTGLTIPATWTRIYLTALVRDTDPLTKAIIQMVETNPADADDGLLYLDGSAPTAASEGTLTVNQSAGTIAIYLTDDASADFSKIVEGAYDIKVLRADGESEQLSGAAFNVILTETKAIT